MNCPSCGAPMRQKLDGFECPYCHTVAFAEKNDEGIRLLAPNPATACPLCAKPLHDASLAGTRLVYCTQCHGMAIAMAVFQALIEQLRTQPAATLASEIDVRDRNRRIPCPHCHRPMIADWYSGGGHVFIDTCEPCSLIWLDHGELSRIAQAPDTLHETTLWA